MAGTPDDCEGPQRISGPPETLAEMLFHSCNEGNRHKIEEFRIKYEAVHGSTDLTKRYTSTWPAADQVWLMKHDIKRYFDGLPPFAKAYLKGKMQIVANDGRLDDVPDSYLRLFISGEMLLDYEEPKGRGR